MMCLTMSGGAYELTDSHLTVELVRWKSNLPTSTKAE